jgi:hypothetical protein
MSSGFCVLIMEESSPRWSLGSGVQAASSGDITLLRIRHSRTELWKGKTKPLWRWHATY